MFFFLMTRRPPRSTRTDTLFPYTTLFRSSSLFLALTATRLKPTRPNNEVCSRFVLNSWLCQVLRSLASVGKGTAFHMGIAHTGAGQHPVTDSQRFNRKENDYGGTCRHHAAID